MNYIVISYKQSQLTSETLYLWISREVLLTMTGWMMINSDTFRVQTTLRADTWILT